MKKDWWNGSDEDVRKRLDEITAVMKKVFMDSILFGEGKVWISEENRAVRICPACKLPEIEHDRTMPGHADIRMGCRGFYFGTER